MKRTILAVALLIALLMSSVCFIPSASAAVTSSGFFGKEGNNLYWSFDSSKGQLNISGKGDMEDLTYSSAIPWWDLRNEIKTVNITDGVTSIGTYSFVGCSSLTSVKISGTVKRISHTAFSSCKSLRSIIIPEGVTEIDSQAFSNCVSLTSVYLPSTLTRLINNPFLGCTGVKDIKFPKGSSYFDVRITKEGSALINTREKTLVWSMNTNYIPDDGSVTILGTYSMAGNSCSGALTVPSAIRTVKDYALYDNPSLTEVRLPMGLEAIGFLSFGKCPKLTSVNIPGTVKALHNTAFNECMRLKEIVFCGTEEDWRVLDDNNNYEFEPSFHQDGYIMLDNDAHRSLCDLCSTGKDEPHVYDREEIKDEYLASEGSCTEPAKYYLSCICGKAGTDTFHTDSLGHEIDEGHYEYDDERHWHICMRCDERVDEEEHSFGEWKTTREPTELKEGRRIRICKICATDQIEPIPPVTVDETTEAETTEEETTEEDTTEEDTTEEETTEEETTEEETTRPEDNEPKETEPPTEDELRALRFERGLTGTLVFVALGTVGLSGFELFRPKKR